MYIAGPDAIPLQENSCVVVLCESWLRDVFISLGLKSLHARTRVHFRVNILYISVFLLSLGTNCCPVCTVDEGRVILVSASGAALVGGGFAQRPLGRIGLNL